MYERRFTTEELAGGEILWLLELEFAGVVWRWATRSVELVDDDGDSVPYLGGLRVRYERSFDLLGGSSADPSVTIDGLQFPPDVDVAELIEAGHQLEGLDAELAMWVENRTYDERWVRVLGRVTAADYGSSDEPIAFSLQPESWDATPTVPAPEAQVTATTWPDASETEVGALYPVVYGRPGRVDTTVTGINCGSPAILVDVTPGSETLLICDGWIYAPAGVANVRVINRTALDSETFAVTLDTDGLGRRVTTVDISGAASVTVNDGDEYWVRFDSEFATGALANDTRTGPMEGAGDVILDLLRRGGERVDTQRFAAVASPLNAYKLAFYVDDPLVPWDYVRGVILPLLPVALAHGASGVYPIMWRPGATAADAVADLDAANGMERVGRVRFDRSMLANEITIGFAPRSDNRSPYYQRTVTGQDVGGDDPTVWTSLYARISRNRHGARGLSIQTRIVWSADTSDRILAWLAAARAMPWRYVDYRAELALCGHLDLGDVVLLTDTDIHWSSALCLVQREAWTDDDLQITFLRIDDPARDTR